jgi:two-component system catabolic regulation response regulator CreB/two-component system response regulator ChvI
MHAAKRRLLIVDDEPDITLTLHTILEQNGFEVVSFNDPLLALRRFIPRYYHLVILDIRMPDMNGFELYRQIRRKDNRVKVCFLTAISEFIEYEQYKKETYPKLGERYFIAKPVSNDELIRRVNEMLSINRSSGNLASVFFLNLSPYCNTFL